VQTSVISLRRYPVKSMGGESLDVANVDARGLVGDRWYAVVDEDGRLASGKNSHRFRRRDAVFEYSAQTEPDGRVVVRRGDSRWYVGDPSLDQRLSEEMRAAVRITPESGVPHHDDGSLSIVSSASLRWCAERWGGSPDPRRLRVNIVLDSDEPFVEEQWVDRELELGAARLRVVQRVPRCRMIDIEQDGTDPGVHWLKPLSQERDMDLAVYADVVRPGRIAVGDQPRPA
jgi:uncharacterized protein YcbX